MSWAHPLVLVALPVALLIVWRIFHRAGAARAARSYENIQRRWADRHGLAKQPLRARRLLRGAALAAGAGAALLALARPQWGEINEPSYERSREVMLALDLSRSMLADDVSPSRLARAKLLIDSLLDQLRGERVGLIVFAGTAFVQSPLSADYEVLRDFLQELDPSYLPEGGTDYEAMLHAATQAFGQQGDGDRYLVVLSDGEALDEHWPSLLPSLKQRGIRVIGLGVGTPAGALVPDGKGGLVKDEHGAAVLSRLEPRTLQDLATETGGAYRDAATWVDVAELVNATVAQGVKGQYVEQRDVRLEDRFQWFLAPALLLLLLSFWLEFPLSPLARALPTRGRRPHPASAPVLAAALIGLAAWYTPRLVLAAVPDTSLPPSGTASQPNPLSATVAELTNKPTLGATDYARLATDTVRFAAQPNAPQDASRAGIIDDALAAVDRGEHADPRAADWPTLRAQLEQLKQAHKEPPPPQEQQQQSQPNQGGEGEKEDQQQQGSGGQQQANQDQRNGQSGSSSDNHSQQSSSEKPQDGQDNQEKDNQANRSDGKDSPTNPKDANGHGGGQDNQEKDAKDSAEPANGGRPNDDTESKPQQAAGEVKRQDDVNPVDAPEASLADKSEKDSSTDQPNDPADATNPVQAAAQAPDSESPPPRPATRMVGGGRAVPAAESSDDPALAEALDKMARIKDGDAPALLFDRMNRAEGQPRAEKHSKNW